MYLGQMVSLLIEKIINSFHYCLLKQRDMHFIEEISVIWSFAPEGNYLGFSF